MLFLLVYRQNNNNNNKKKQTKKQKDLTNIQFQLDWPRNSIVIQRFNIVPSLCVNPQKMICSEWESIMNRKFRKIFEKEWYIHASLIVSLNTQSCSTHPQMVNRGLSGYNTENLTVDHSEECAWRVPHSQHVKEILKLLSISKSPYFSCDSQKVLLHQLAILIAECWAVIDQSI